MDDYRERHTPSNNTKHNPISSLERGVGFLTGPGARCQLAPSGHRRVSGWQDSATDLANLSDLLSRLGAVGPL